MNLNIIFMQLMVVYCCWNAPVSIHTTDTLPHKPSSIIGIHRGRLCYCTSDNEIITYDYLRKKSWRSHRLGHTPIALVPLDNARVAYLCNKNMFHIFDHSSNAEKIIDTFNVKVTNIIAAGDHIYMYDCLSDTLISYDTLIGTTQLSSLDFNKGIISISHVDDKIYLTGRIIVCHDFVKGWVVISKAFDSKKMSIVSKFQDTNIEKTHLARWCSNVSSNQLLALANTDEFYLVNGNTKSKLIFPNAASMCLPIKQGDKVHYLDQELQLCTINVNHMTHAIMPSEIKGGVKSLVSGILSDTHNSSFLIYFTSGKLITITIPK